MTPTSERHDHIVHGNKHHVPSAFLVFNGAWPFRMPQHLQIPSAVELTMNSKTIIDTATSPAAMPYVFIKANSYSIFTACLTVYLLGLAIYRLYLTPTAKFPGPRLAALCYWYEFYYDVWPHEGQYTWKIRKLHEKYGMRSLSMISRVLCHSRMFPRPPV